MRATEPEAEHGSRSSVRTTPAESLPAGTPRLQSHGPVEQLPLVQLQGTPVTDAEAAAHDISHAVIVGSVVDTRDGRVIIPQRWSGAESLPQNCPSRSKRTGDACSRYCGQDTRKGRCCALLGVAALVAAAFVLHAAARSLFSG